MWNETSLNFEHAKHHHYCDNGKEANYDNSIIHDDDLIKTYFLIFDSKVMNELKNDNLP